MASLLSRFPDKFDRVLDHLDSIFWDEQLQTDHQTPAFYVYKSYPSSVSGKRLESWIKLQEKALSPYKSGKCYSIALKKGVAFWFAKSEFNGAPESSRQRALSDGTWFVKGKSLAYRQTWQDGIMLNCELLALATLPEDSVAIGELERKSSWAQSRQIDEFIRQPIFGFTIVGVAALFVAVWLSTAYFAQFVGEQRLASTMSELDDALGETLLERERYQRNLQSEQGLSEWRNQFGHLPDTLAAVITIVEKQTPWKAGKIRWQSGLLKVTLFSQELDITALVKDLEDTALFKSVSVRPQEKAHLWSLEVEVND